MKYILLSIIIFGAALVFSSCTADNAVLNDNTDNVPESAQNDAFDEPSSQDAAESVSLATEIDDYINVKDDKVEAPAYSLKIPENFEVKASDNNLLLENKKGTIQFNIMDKTSVTDDFAEYAEATYNAAKAGGMATSEIEDITINGICMKRFSTEVKQEKAKLTAYVYFAQTNGRIIMITLTSKNGGLDDAKAANEFVAQIDF